MEARNIILITIDSLRWDTVQYMPTLTSLAEKYFHSSRAYSNGPSTPFSFPSLFNRNYDPLLDPIKIRTPTLTEDLKQSGYKTIGIVASNPYISALSGYQIGFDRFEDYISLGGRDAKFKLWKTFQRFPKIVRNLRELYRWYVKKDITSSSGGQLVVDSFVRQLPAEDDEPFFFWVHFMDTHYPYTPPLDHTDFSLGDIIYLNNFRRERSGRWRDEKSDDIDRLERLYIDSSTWLDKQLSRLIRVLKERDLWNHTDIVITSDHGEAFGEHGFLGHPSHLYEENVRVPLILKMDDIVFRKEEMIELRDVPTTLSPFESYTGKNLKEEMEDSRFIPLRARHAGGRSCMKKGVNLISKPEILEYGIYGIVTERYKLIYDEEGEKVELYDLKEDPREKKDLSQEEVRIKEELLQIFKSFIKAPLNKNL